MQRQGESNGVDDVGVNNRQRRAAKAKRRARDRAHGAQPHGPAGPDPFGSAGREHEVLEFGRNSLLDLLASIGQDPRRALSGAADLLANRNRAHQTGQVASRAREVVALVCRGGWSPNDLAEILRRRAGGAPLPTLHTLLAEDCARFPAEQVDPRWRAEIAALPDPAPLVPDEVDSLAGLLTVAGVLSTLGRIAELIPPPGAAPAATGPAAAPSERAAKQLARVRALLAKAESTPYEAEAEALTDKAQDLISRYALARLLDRADTAQCPAGIVARRIWIDAPYVSAKAALLDAVAKANRARTVLTEALGVLTVIGEDADLDAVDLLGTSLLVQANTAMRRHGSQLDRSGTSRTRSFRQSFLLSYAVRIAERLRAVDEHAAAETGQPERLLPVLRAAEHAVDEHIRRLFPRMHFVGGPRATDGHGWAAGRAAADLAVLDLREPIGAGV